MWQKYNEKLAIMWFYEFFLSFLKIAKFLMFNISFENQSRIVLK